MDSFVDISKAKKELGWEPKVKFTDGLKQMYVWMCEEFGIEHKTIWQILIGH